VLQELFGTYVTFFFHRFESIQAKRVAKWAEDFRSTNGSGCDFVRKRTVNMDELHEADAAREGVA
jgi:hypothetical protein